MLDEHRLRGGGAALHAVDHDHVGSRVHGELDVVEDARRADLHVDRLLPIGDLAQLLDLDHQIVGAGPVRMARGGALIDPLGQGAHARHPRVDLLTEQHAAAAGLRALADDDLDRIRPPHVVGIEPVARGQALVHQRLRSGALLGGHAAVAGRGRGAHLGCRAAERLLDPRGKRAEAHARDRDRDRKLDGPRCEARAQQRLGRAPLAISLERIARQGGREEQQVVEIRHPALGAEPANFVQPARRGALNVVDGVTVEARRFLALDAAHASTPDRHPHANDTDSWPRPPA